MQSYIVTIENLSPEEILQMLSLMQKYYDNVKEPQFRKDLYKKDRAIILKDKGMISGFSTQKLLKHEIDGKKVNIMFSGDTIIDAPSRWSMKLHLVWGRMMLDVKKKSTDSLYWLLTTKGPSTYRFLPVYFKKYYPHQEYEIPNFEKKLVESFCSKHFAERYQPEKWLLKAGAGAQRLKYSIDEIENQKKRNSDVAFFKKMNPGFLKGDELICIANFKEDNLSPFVWKRLLKK